MRAFLAPILVHDGRSCRAMGRVRAKLRKEDPDKKSSQYGELFARLLREPGDPEFTTTPTGYPSPKTAWEYARVFRAAGLDWAAGPLVLYGVGQVSAFVGVIAGTDEHILPARQLWKMLDQLPRAIEGWDQARRLWADRPALRAFPSPESARIPNPAPESILLARAIAEDLRLPFELQRSTVLHFLKRWIQKRIAQSEA